LNNKKTSYLGIFRTIIQLIFFILLPGLYANAFLGIKIIYQGFLNNNFSFQASFPMLISAISIIPLTLLFGRFFCGWMCAFGTMGDFMYYVGNRIFKIKFKMNSKVDGILKYAKYVVFLMIFMIVWSMDKINISALSPWDAFGSLLTFTQLPDFSYVITEITVGFILLIAIMIASMFVKRFFCRYLCPMGAVFAIVSSFKFVRIRKPSSQCGNCRACTKKCPMGIPLYSMNRVDSLECIDCMQCVTVCPRNNVSVNVVATPANPAVVGALAVTAMSGLYYISTFVTDSSSSITGSNLTEQTTPESNSPYADGSYEGSGIGFRGATTKLSVTIDQGQITNVETLSYGDDAPYYNNAFQSVVSGIIKAQDTEVDAVSGATFSSNGIMEAVTSALELAKQAKNNVIANNIVTPTQAPVTEGDLKANTNGHTKNNSSNNSKNTNNGQTSNSNNAQTSNTKNSKDGITNNTSNTQTNNSNSTTDVATNKYKNGTYKGKAHGFRNGVTTVSVTVKNNAIQDISIVSNEDDAPFFNSACDVVIGEILDSQSTKVHAVSGATYSSNGIMNAVADALSKAVITN